MSARLVDAHAWAWQLPLIAPFPVGRKWVEERRGFLIRLENDRGDLGYGEIAPLPGFSREDPESVGAALPGILERLVKDLPPIAREAPRLDLPEGLVRFGIECALLDLSSRTFGVRPEQILAPGECWEGEIPVAALLELAHPEFRERLRARREEGYHCFKIKIGVDHEKELAAFEGLVEAMGTPPAPSRPGVPAEGLRFRLDANRSLDEKTLAAWQERLTRASFPLEYFEEPTPTMGDDLTGRFPIAMDESLLALAQNDDWAAAIPEHVRAFILKPSQFPSFEKLGAICRFARERGIALVASSALDTDVGIAAWFPAVRAWFHHRGHLPALGLDPLRWFEHGLALTAPVFGPVLSADSFRLAGMRLRETALRSIHPAADEGRKPSASVSGTLENVGDGGSLPSPSVWLAEGTHLESPMVERLAESYSLELSRLGVGCGDTVALLGRETPAALFLLLALWRLGAVACPLPRRLPPGALSEMLERLRPCLLVNDSEMDVTASSLTVRRATYRSDGAMDPPTLRLLVSSPSGAPARSFPDNRPGSSENVAALLFTSGSSAQPKIAILSMAAFLANARAAAARIPLAPGDAWCANLPFNHVGGLSIIFRAALSGASLAFPSAGEPIPARATHLSVVSSQLVMLTRDARHRSRLASLKAVLLGGGPIPLELCRELVSQSVPLFASYGLTETASQVATSPLQASDFDPGPPGVEALPGVEIRIGDRDEILVRSPSLFSGYLESQARGRSLDPSGYFPTGDRGRMGGDGKLQVLGRLDHLIISGGENIQPEEIERALRRILPVSEAVVAGISHPIWGQRPVAFLEWNEGAAIPPETELKRLLRAHLPGFKIPDYFFPWPTEDGTRTPNGKVSRAFFSALAKRLGEEASKAAEP